MVVRLQVTGLEELSRRFRNAPQKFQAGMKKTMEASLLILWESVPPYPGKPEGSTYTRTGTLGRTLGSGEAGGKAAGEPDIYIVKQNGTYTSGEFGTHLNYAPYVIGDNTQAWMHRGRWWTMSKLAERAAPKIIRAFEIMKEEMVKFLDRGR